MKNRLRKMFAIAIHYNYKSLVLGALRCGAFGNDANIVAKYFYKLLFNEGYRYHFDKIIFTKYDRGEKKNYSHYFHQKYCSQL